MGIFRYLILQFGLIFFLFLYSASTWAQSHEVIRTGRPGQAIGPFILGTGWFQNQSGVDLSGSNRGGVSSSATNLNSVFRIGLTESFELSGLLSHQWDQQSSFNQSGVKDFHLGFRFNVIDKSDSFVPALGVQVRFKTLAVGNSYRAENLAPVILVATKNKLADYLDLIVNLGLSYDGLSPVVTHNYVVNFSFPLSGSWGGFFEFYGNEKSGVDKHYFDFGVGYLLNNDLQIDLYGGYGKNQSVAESFVSFGVSWRHQMFSR